MPKVKQSVVEKLAYRLQRLIKSWAAIKKSADVFQKLLQKLDKDVRVLVPENPEGPVARTVARHVREDILPDLEPLLAEVQRVLAAINGQGAIVPAPTPAPSGAQEEDPVDVPASLRALAEMMAYYLNIDPKGIPLAALKKRFEGMLDEDYALLNWLIEQIAGKKDATDDEVRAALNKFQTTKPAAPDLSRVAKVLEGVRDNDAEPLTTEELLTIIEQLRSQAGV